MIIFDPAVFAVALLIVSAAAFYLIAKAAKMLAAPDFDEREAG